MSKRDGITCVICGKEKSDRAMFKHRNINIDEGFGFCKDCMNVQTEHNDIDTVIDSLRMMNIPFVGNVWENATESGGNATFSKYLQLIATQKRYKDFNDSEFEDESDGSQASIEVTDEIIAKWGIRDSVEEYTELEFLYSSLTKIKEPATLFEEKRYVQNVKLGKAVDDALEGGDVKSVPQLRKAYADDLKDLGLDVKQSSEDDARTLGIRIAEWERHDPIPEISEFSDVDNIQEYISKWFLLPLKRVFGRASEEEINKLYE